MKPKAEVIANLIALSASDNIEEARTAAFKACKMIREGKFKLVATEEEKPKVQTPAANPSTPNGSTSGAWTPNPVSTSPPGGVKYRPPSRQWSDYYAKPSSNPFGHDYDASFEDLMEAFRKAGIR